LALIGPGKNNARRRRLETTETTCNWKSDICAYDYTNPNWEKGARGKKCEKPESRRERTKSPNAQKTLKPSKCASFFGYPKDLDPSYGNTRPS